MLAKYVLPIFVVTALAGVGTRESFAKPSTGNNLGDQICEADIIIVLDSSGSIGAVEFEIAKDFVRRLAIPLAKPPYLRVSLMTYRESSSTVVSLSANASPPELDAAVRNIVYRPGGGRRTDFVLHGVRAAFTVHQRGASQIMVLITVGVSDDPYKTQIAAESVKAGGIVGVAVGITNQVNLTEMLGIAGGNPDHVFFTPDYNTILDLLRRLICLQNNV